MRWLRHFYDSFTGAVKDPVVINPIKPYLTRLAMGLVNREDEPVPGERIRDVSDSVFMQSVQRDDAAGIAKDAAEYPHVLPMHGPKLLLVAVVRGKLRAAPLPGEETIERRRR